jgi:hypothetical protein
MCPILSLDCRGFRTYYTTGVQRRVAAEVKRVLTWLPAFVVGATTAVAAHLAIGVLLFEDERMFQSLTIIMGVEWGALALGLGSAVSPTSEAMDSLRRRWVLLLVAFSGAAGFALAWTLGRGLGGVPLTQGTGLALLGALPLYTCGLVLRALSAVSARSREPFGVAGPAALGASAGILFTGMMGITRVGAPSLLLFSLMLLSGSALIQGWLLDEPQIQDPQVGEPSGGDEEE